MTLTLPHAFKLEALTLLRGTIDGLPVIRPTARVLEAGAGWGTVTAALTRLASFVVALEPIPGNYDHLRERTAFTTNLVTVPAALGGPGATGTLDLFQYDQPWQSSAHLLDLRAPARVVQAPVVAVDELIARWDIDTLVLDIEGGEADVLAGADLTAVHTLVLEWHTPIIGAETVQKLGQELQEAGLVLRFHTPSWSGDQSFALYRRDLR